MIEYQEIEEQRDALDIVSHTEKMIKIVGSKWGLLILRELHFRNHPIRFNELLHELGSISSRTLSAQLKKLVECNMIQKKVLSTSPPRVEYSLTEKGIEFNDIIYLMAQWSFKWHDNMV